MAKEKRPIHKSLVHILGWADTFWQIFGGLSLSGLSAFVFAFVAWIYEQPYYAIILYGLFAFYISWGLLEKIKPSWFKLENTKYLPIRQFGWDMKSFLNVHAQKHSVGTSEDMMVYGPIQQRVTSFQIRGRNNRKSPVDSVSGFIVSNKTNRKLPILLDGMPPEQTYGIPGKCDFYISAIFPSSDGRLEGYAPDDFWNHFGDFTFHFEFGGKKYKKCFSKTLVQEFIESRIQQSTNGLTPSTDRPRVKKKETT